MNGLWTFSPSSEHLLQQCIDSAGQSNNKWSRAFHVESAVVDATPLEVMDVSESNGNAISQASDCNELIKSLCESIEHDLPEKISFIQQECKDATIWTQLATNLSNTALEKLYTYIFDYTNDVEDVFVRNCFCYTLPAVLNAQTSWYCIDLLKNIWKQYKAHFMNIILAVMLKNTLIPSHLLHDFLQNLTNEDKCTIFTEVIDLKLTFEQFQHHINTIYLLYKEMGEDSLAGSYIFSYLQSFHDKCSNDKVFGRLLLLYIQRVKIPPSGLERVIEDHMSAFKKPCLAAYAKLK